MDKGKETFDRRSLALGTLVGMAMPKYIVTLTLCYFEYLNRAKVCGVSEDRANEILKEEVDRAAADIDRDTVEVLKIATRRIAEEPL